MTALTRHRSGYSEYPAFCPTYGRSACCYLLNLCKRHWRPALQGMVASMLVGCVTPPAQYYDSAYSRYYVGPASWSTSPRYYRTAPRYRSSYFPPTRPAPDAPPENGAILTERPSIPQLPAPMASISDAAPSGQIARVAPPPKASASSPTAPSATLSSFTQQHAKESQSSAPSLESTDAANDSLNYENVVAQNPRTELMRLWNTMALTHMGSRGIALFSKPGELNTSVPNLFAMALGDMSSEKKEILRATLADPGLLGWARDMGKFVISYLPISSETADANMKAFSDALPVLVKPLAHMPEEIEFDAWYAYSIKRVPVPEFWAEAYGRESWNPTAVYVYAFLLRRETDQKDPTLKSDTVKAWQELIHGWADALALRVMSATWVVAQPPSKSGTTPVSVRSAD